jgi:hypothetical protein
VEGGTVDGIRGAETDGAKLLRMSTDAAVWAREMSEAFWRAAEPVPGSPIDPEPGGLLHVWLANAIEAGRAAGYAEGAEAGRLTGWREALVARAGRDAPDVLAPPPPELAADLAGSHAADSAGSVPADLAGSDRVASALEELVTLMRCVVAPHGHSGGGGIRTIGDRR